MGIAYKYVSLILLVDVLSILSDDPLIGWKKWLARGLLMSVAIFDTFMDSRRKS